nr:MAG TPA: hypothetical protein [Caudoviricetes sp.]
MPRYERGREYHCRCSGDFKSRRIRVFAEWCAYIILRVVSLKSVASTIIVVWLRNNYQKKYRYESKTDYLFKYDNCAWIYSECSCSVVFSKYEYCHYSAWNILGNCAWNILEQYDNWQVVLPRAVEIYTPLGKFRTAWSVRDLESTKIVLGNI